MRRILFFIAALFAVAPAWAEVPKVVASVRPVQTIAAAVMKGVGVPQVLLGNAASLHAHALKPSEARLLSQAKVVFWVGPSLEAFLTKPIAALAGKARVISLMNAPGLEILTSRAGGVWEQGEEPRDPTLPDGHIWLSPPNAVAMANAMAEALAVADPVNATEYWANAETFSREAMALDRDLHIRLAAVRQKPFLVFHDAYQYFEARYRLAALGSISVTPDQPPSARRLTAIQERLREAKAVCIFSEPQFEPRHVQMLVEEAGARAGVLDPEGAALKDGPNLYFTLMRGLADELLRCLG
ncbi:MAG: zinc ABC transporter substrate-binding protein [Proteobacteria bacterium]|nr:zinc ABC transporter substrate-binding protein [Pseudomonadota bacterium]